MYILLILSFDFYILSKCIEHIRNC